MGAKINAIKEFFGVGAKKAVAEAKKEAPKAATKEVSAETVKDMQAAEASYGKANIAMQSTGKKKAYVRPETTVVKIENNEGLMAGSTGGTGRVTDGPGSQVDPTDDDPYKAKPWSSYTPWADEEPATPSKPSLWD